MALRFYFSLICTNARQETNSVPNCIINFTDAKTLVREFLGFLCSELLNVYVYSGLLVYGNREFYNLTLYNIWHMRIYS